MSKGFIPVFTYYFYGERYKAWCPLNLSTSHFRETLMSNRLEVRLLSRLMMLDPNVTTDRACECDFNNVGRVEIFNDLQLPSPVYNKMQSYIYEWFLPTFGQHELLYTNDSNCLVNHDM